MRAFISTLFICLALVAEFASAADVRHNPSWRKRRHPRAPAEGFAIEQIFTSRALERRFDGARFTFYDAGLGACGKVNSGADHVVAMNSAQFAGGAHCFEMLTITANGRTASAQIVDECPGCPFAGLDFSRGLFDVFDSESAGVVTGSWNFGAGAPPPPPPPPKPTTTHVPSPPPPPPKTTEHPTPSFSPPAPPTTTPSSKHTSPTPTSASSDAFRSASHSGNAAPAPSSVAPPPPPLGNFEQMYLAFVQIGSIAVAGANASRSS